MPTSQPHLSVIVTNWNCIGADDVKKVLSSVGIDAEQERLDTLLRALEGKQLHELIAAGTSKLSTLSGKPVIQNIDIRV